MDCPYFNLPSPHFWKKSVSDLTADAIDPHLPMPLKIDFKTAIGSAGSCFAQNISHALVERGYNYHVTEKPPESLPAQIAEQYGYGMFSARYGNIYTPLQLLQLLERAFDGKCPSEQVWTDSKGRVYDLLRPRITPRGFSSFAEWETDHASHLDAVRKLFSEMKVFIFTLGLTEAWLSRQDETVYPTCPGCGSPGDYDSAKYYFHNFTVQEVTEHLDMAISKISQINPDIEIILTVSPVPLLATMEPRHVLQSTVYSKSVLRVAAENAVKARKNVHYFASYELITATCQTNTFFESDRRTVSATGISYVMANFFGQFASEDKQASVINKMETFVTPNAFDEVKSDQPKKPFCDEESFFQAIASKEQV